MATPGATADLILRGKKVIGSRIVGVVVEDSAGSATFRLPPGLKLGTYTMTAQASGLNSNVLSFKVVARIPKPRRTPSPSPSPRRLTSRLSRQRPSSGSSTMLSRLSQVQTASVSNGHVVDQAVHILVQNPLLFNNKKKGH